MGKAQKIKFACSYCGSDNVTCDACAAWDVESQSWQIVTDYDNTDCQECGGECSVDAVPADAVCISKWEQMARKRGWASDDEPGDHDATPERDGVKAACWADACAKEDLSLVDYEYEQTSQ